MSWIHGAFALAICASTAAVPYALASRTVVIDVNDRAPRFFAPDVARVKSGDTVVFSLSHNHLNGAPHTMTSVAGPEAFDSGVIHWSYSWTPRVPGEYTYVCAIHPYMKGIIAVDVEPSVEAAVVGEGGSWPPDVTPRMGPPPVPGEGEIWVDLQWYEKPGRPDEPGAVVVVDAATWQIKRVLPFGNNPHNLSDSVDGRYVYQTSWHDDRLGIYDRLEERWIKIMSVGAAPAHVAVTPDGRAYVTLNAERRVAIVEPETFTVERSIELEGLGPHGIWTDRDGRWMVAAVTLSDRAAIIDAETGQEVAELPVGRLPLAASITADGTKAYIPAALGGNITVIDVPGRRVTRVIDNVGKVLIQVPFTPDDRYAVQAATGSAEAIILDARTDEIIKRIPTHLGAHGVTFGRKSGGGWYAYVSHKFADILSIIDMDTLELAGELKLPAPGGNGIHAIPNVWREAGRKEIAR